MPNVSESGPMSAGPWAIEPVWEPSTDQFVVQARQVHPEHGEIVLYMTGVRRAYGAKGLVPLVALVPKSGALRMSQRAAGVWAGMVAEGRALPGLPDPMLVGCPAYDVSLQLALLVDGVAKAG